MAESVKRVRGVHDILPEDAHLWRFVEWIIHAVMATYGYQEIRTPVFESTELFIRGVGLETDIVNKEMYTFEDKGGKSLTLKPELTAPVVRAYVQNHLDREAPIARLYYLDSLFRQERPQKGRLRQFNQFGVEAIGSSHPEQDVEVIALAYDLCNLFEPEGLSIRLNTIGSTEGRANYLAQLQTALEPYAAELSELDQQRLRANPLRLFDSKSPATQALLDEKAPLISDYLTEEDRQNFNDVQDGLKALNIPFEHDPKLVRGLDYYTRTTFEITSQQLGAQDALCGGGRYDKLVSQLGGPDTPAVGFAAGMERLLLVAGDRLKEKITPRQPDVYLIVLSDDARTSALVRAQELRASGYTVILETLRRSTRAQFREANRVGAKAAVILGEEEMKTDTCTIKNMTSGDQQTVSPEQLSSALDAILHPPAEDASD
ncbi:MAG: histidine--tRNA ligase [Fidelibacterota bacterium]|nr:MAG: histidine--tRNA ligase [Candidatus Neomarinimicrobiota bacterium]